MRGDSALLDNLKERISIWKSAWGLSWILILGVLAVTTAEVSQFLGMVQFQGASLRFTWQADTSYHHYRLLLQDHDFTDAEAEVRMVKHFRRETALEIPVFPGHAYQLQVQGVTAAGDTSIASQESPLYLCLGNFDAGVSDAPNFLPQSNTLGFNYPNPFNHATTIPYAVAATPGSATQVSLNVYNLSGQVVRHLLSAEQPAGQYRSIWEGNNDQGGMVSAGQYICLLQVGDWSATRLVSFVK